MQPTTSRIGPQPGQHLHKARHNGLVRCGLDSIDSPCNDWKVVVDFYEALHWVEVYLRQCHPNLARWNHRQRNEQVRAYLPQIHDEYTMLYRASQRCRYNPSYTPKPSDVLGFDSDVEYIREYVKNRLGIP